MPSLSRKFRLRIFYWLYPFAFPIWLRFMIALNDGMHRLWFPYDSPTGQPQEHFDAVGLLLMIRINFHHQLIMSRRRLPCLDHYLDRVNLLIWPRFKVVLEAHITSIRNASEKLHNNMGPHAGEHADPRSLLKPLDVFLVSISTCTMGEVLWPSCGAELLPFGVCIPPQPFKRNLTLLKNAHQSASHGDVNSMCTRYVPVTR